MITLEYRTTVKIEKQTTGTLVVSDSSSFFVIVTQQLNNL